MHFSNKQSLSLLNQSELTGFMAYSLPSCDRVLTYKNFLCFSKREDMPFPAKSHITHLKGWWWYLQVQSQMPREARLKSMMGHTSRTGRQDDSILVAEFCSLLFSYRCSGALPLFLVRITSFPSFPFPCCFLCNSVLFAFQLVPSNFFS